MVSFICEIFVWGWRESLWWWLGILLIFGNYKLFGFFNLVVVRLVGVWKLVESWEVIEVNYVVGVIVFGCFYVNF